MTKVYYFNYINNEFEIDSFFSEYRLNKIKTLTNKIQINRNIQTEYAIKLSLSHFLNCDITEISFKVNEFGKPILEHNDLYLNVTNSNDHLFIAISNNNIGIDLEKIDDKHKKISNKIFKVKKEYSTKEVIKAFTLKESYIKYYGKSILYDLKSIEIEDNFITGPLGKLKYVSIQLNEYILSIVAINIDNIDTFIIKDLNDLISIDKFNIINKSQEEEDYIKMVF